MIGGAPSCFETHRSAARQLNPLPTRRAAMLLSMRAGRAVHFGETEPTAKYVLRPSQEPQPAGVEKERRGGRPVSGLLFTGTSATRACGAVGAREERRHCRFQAEGTYLRAGSRRPTSPRSVIASGSPFAGSIVIRERLLFWARCDAAHTSLLTLSLKSRQGKKECRVGIRETRH